VIEALLGAIVLAAYLICARAYAKRYPHRRFGFWRMAAFCSGVAIAVIALSPAIDTLVDASFAAHMVQHLALALVVPPLLLLGAPLLLLVSLPAPSVGKAIARFARHPTVLFVVSPVMAWLAFVAVLWGIHFSPLYEMALRSLGVHIAEHALLLSVALVFWMSVVQVGYSPHQVPFPVRIFYLFLAIPQGAFLGLAIYSSKQVLYAHYLVGRSFGAALTDQQNAGAIMWIGGGALLFVAFMLTAVVWAARGRQEEAIV